MSRDALIVPCCRGMGKRADVASVGCACTRSRAEAVVALEPRHKSFRGGLPASPGNDCVLCRCLVAMSLPAVCMGGKAWPFL